MRRLSSICVGALIAGPFYLLLIDTVSTPELIAGGGACLIAALAFAFAYAEGVGHGSYRLSWLTKTWRILVDVPRQVAVVCKEIVVQAFSPQPVRGQLRSAPFVSEGDDARDRGRRVLAEALGSLTPNTIVIGVDPDSQTLLVHQLRREGGVSQLDPLGLGGSDDR